MAEQRIIRPQPGYQTKALSSNADIVIGGAAAGVGKTFTLLLDPLRDMHVPGFGGVIFRRTTTQIRNEGGLWDTSKTIYPGAGGEPKESVLEWQFKKNKLKFSHLEHEKNIYDWQGAQIPFIAFDELTHFSKKMFFYLLTRNRSVCGVKPYCRATCNPDPESWVFELIEWWIDPDTGYPIPERDGVVRYMLVDGDNYIWGDSYEEVIKKGWFLLEGPVTKSGIDPKEFVKSVTFVSGSIYDNKMLLKIDPAYLGNLMAQDEETKAQLLHGNWKVVLSDKDIYDHSAFTGIMDNVRSVTRTGKYITADIAMEGSNMFIVGYWEGWELMDIEIVEKSKGDKVIEVISSMAKRYSVNNIDIVYDADGVGAFVDGFIKGATPFHGGAGAMDVRDEASGKIIKENYFNVRTQCYYRSGLRCARGDLKINSQVLNRMYNDKMTVRQRMMFERKAIKKASKTPDGKLKIISKDEMKAKLNGDSPDILDMIMMREFAELKPKKKLAWA